MILPLFVRAGDGPKLPIASMPGHFQLTLEDLAAEVREADQLGLAGVILFGIPAAKDAVGSDAYPPLIAAPGLYVRDLLP